LEHDLFPKTGIHFSGSCSEEGAGHVSGPASDSNEERTLRALRAIGLMSGTSLDGIDLALLETDGMTVASFGPTGYRAYSASERECLRRALLEAVSLEDRAARPGVLNEAETLVTDAHGSGVEHFLDEHSIARSEISIIGFHGQTVLHRPEAKLTVQIGNGHGLAQRLGIAVAFDLRARDMAEGGQGAPLVPIFHRAMVERLGPGGPVAVLNIGGVANLTYVDGSDQLIACDVGPGNALLDDFMLARTGKPYDRDGAAAAAGKVEHDLVEAFLDHPFFASPPPKSLDRNAFHMDFGALSVADGAATLTAITAAAVARSSAFLPALPSRWIVAGGGARNPTLMRMLREQLRPALVEPAGSLGWSSDALEAQAFAYLAVRSLRGLPLTFPGTTGVPHPTTGGVIARVP
jgi:anhydro-N-acetylmuramic acid kinase